MQMYRAMIIGFKKSKNKIGHYYPIFEYENQYGEIRTYVRQKSMERTPFTINKNYIICKKGFKTHERTEKRLAPHMYFFALRIFLLAVAFANPKIAMWTAATNIGVNAGYEFIKIVKKYNLKVTRDVLEDINGKIVGYKKVHNKISIDETHFKYLPLIEYRYKDKTYVHIGKIACEEEQRSVGAVCKIYVSAKKQLVVDEFEINAPILDIPNLSTESIKSTYERIMKRTRKIKEIELQKRQRTTNEPMAVGMCPLRTLDCGKVANWY